MGDLIILHKPVWISVFLFFYECTNQSDTWFPLAIKSIKCGLGKWIKVFLIKYEFENKAKIFKIVFIRLQPYQ